MKIVILFVSNNGVFVNENVVNIVLVNVVDEGSNLINDYIVMFVVLSGLVIFFNN